MKTWFVYLHICPNDKVYVGITCKKNPNYRWENGTGYSGCTYFNHAIKKFGWDNIRHEIILEGILKSEAVYTEKYLIRWYKIHNKSYNLTDGGDGISGIKLSEEHKRKIAEANRRLNLGRPTSEKTKLLLAAIFSKPVILIDSTTMETIAEYNSIKNAAIGIGHPGKENNIAHSLHGRNLKAFGYIWKFKNK